MDLMVPDPVQVKILALAFAAILAAVVISNDKMMERLQKKQARQIGTLCAATQIAVGFSMLLIMALNLCSSLPPTSNYGGMIILIIGLMTIAPCALEPY